MSWVKATLHALEQAQPAQVRSLLFFRHLTNRPTLKAADPPN
ncbi:MAG: hypothetical protein R3C14_28980 [Caldilineaceae bacterium]